MLASFTDAERIFLTRIVGTKIIPTLEALAKNGTAYAFEQWLMVTRESRKLSDAIKLQKEVERIMVESHRGDRLPTEKASLLTYMSGLACLPSEITPAAWDTLCNEVDYVRTKGKSILFLQGDFGNVYYIIARGEVKLYLCMSKDREMEIGREFGALRGVPYTGDMDTLNKLGINIATLKQGQGFGEFAILSTSGKLRMCAAVASTDDTFMFIMHGDTYNTVLRQHHYRSKQLSAATALLQQLPIFNTYSYSKLSNVAYGMKSSTFSNTSVLVRAGAPIINVFIVNVGQVKVMQAAAQRPEASNADGVLNAQETLEMRLPRLAHAIMGKGSIVGQHELNNGLTVFTNTYVSCRNDTAVFELPAAAYRECCLSADIRATPVAQTLNDVLNQRERTYRERVERTSESAKKFAMAHARSVDDKAQLLRLLPLLIDGVTLDSNGTGDGGGGGSAKKAAAGSFNKFSKDATTADIVKSVAERNARARGGTAGLQNDTAASPYGYGYDPSVSREDNESLFNEDEGFIAVRTHSRAHPTSSPSPGRSALARAGPSSMSPRSPWGAYAGTGAGAGTGSAGVGAAATSPMGKSRHFPPSPRASRVLPASSSAVSTSMSMSAPTTPRPAGADGQADRR
jgi:CRP-like cAMP-binding protein